MMTTPGVFSALDLYTIVVRMAAKRQGGLRGRAEQKLL